jgi:hypothetical protein
VYGGKPDWEKNVEAGRRVGAEIEQAVQKLELENVAKSDYFGSLTAIQNNAGLGASLLSRLFATELWLRGMDLNHRPLGYELRK